jgi:hypothetical protein
MAATSTQNIGKYAISVSTAAFRDNTSTIKVAVINTESGKFLLYNFDRGNFSPSRIENIPEQLK